MVSIFKNLIFFKIFHTDASISLASANLMKLLLRFPFPIPAAGDSLGQGTLHSDRWPIATASTRESHALAVTLALRFFYFFWSSLDTLSTQFVRLCAYNFDDNNSNTKGIFVLYSSLFQHIRITFRWLYVFNSAHILFALPIWISYHFILLHIATELTLKLFMRLLKTISSQHIFNLCHIRVHIVLWEVGKSGPN